MNAIKLHDPWDCLCEYEHVSVEETVTRACVAGRPQVGYAIMDPNLIARELHERDARIAALEARLAEAEKERDRLAIALDGERALCRRLEYEFSAARTRIMADQGVLYEHLALMVQQFEEEASQGDGILEEHSAGYEAAKALLRRMAKLEPSWENAQIEIHDLIDRASRLPGMSATLDEFRFNLSRAVRLLHMTSRSDAPHPDVTLFLDEVER